MQSSISFSKDWFQTTENSVCLVGWFLRLSRDIECAVISESFGRFAKASIGSLQLRRHIDPIAGQDSTVLDACGQTRCRCRIARILVEIVHRFVTNQSLSELEND